VATTFVTYTPKLSEPKGVALQLLHGSWDRDVRGLSSAGLGRGVMFGMLMRGVAVAVERGALSRDEAGGRMVKKRDFLGMVLRSRVSQSDRARLRGVFCVL